MAKPGTTPDFLPRWQRLAEIALIFVVFNLFAGGFPPGEDEPHYLCKARHYWDPAWCPNDLFLNSGDAHASFYWTFGWVTALAWNGEHISLEAAALICRLVLWMLQAWAWWRLSRTMVPRPLFSVFSATLFLVLLHHGTMAREWIVGDVEAKGVAYVFVFLGLEALLKRRWSMVFPLMGAAAGFHVIVGGWAVVASGVAWLMSRFPQVDSGEESPSLVRLLPPLLLGGLLSLPGLIPCLLLDRGTPPETVAQGTIVYVYARLSHHLVISRMDPWHIVRHVMLIAMVALLGRTLRRDRFVWPLLAFIGGAVLLEIVGVAIDQGLASASNELRARLLRYYWYRLGDAMVPVGLALLVCRWIALEVTQTKVRMLVAAALLVFAAGNLVELQRKRMQAGVPEGNLRLQRNSVAAVSLLQRHQDWLACCRWIREHTPYDATFLTPRGQQTFLWYAQRAEVVNWKNCPQDAASIVAWLKRFEDVFPDPDGGKIMYGAEIDPRLPGHDRLTQLGHKYDVQYLMIDHSEQPLLPLPRVYPSGDEFNVSFSVYRLSTDAHH